jgi:hypothetical protein
MYSIRNNAHSPIGKDHVPARSAEPGGASGGDGFNGDKPPINIAVAAEDGPDDDGDIIYGARAISTFIFGVTDNPCRARRRVFNLAAHYKARNENAGFFKLKGALCLSKKQWRRFHGLS